MKSSKIFEYISIQLICFYISYFLIMFIGWVLFSNSIYMSEFVEKFQLLLPIVPTFLISSFIFFEDAEKNNFALYLKLIIIPTIIYIVVFVVYYNLVLANIY